jgi:hypothetical protein
MLNAQCSICSQHGAEPPKVCVCASITPIVSYTAAKNIAEPLKISESQHSDPKIDIWNCL